jgi:hypothetical protein
METTSWRCTFPIDDRWLKLTNADLESFAQAWIDELHGSKTAETEVGMSVTWMGFTAPADMQWQFILAAIRFAESDDELGHVAAGPIECLLGWHGPEFIDRVEQQAQRDMKFARAMTGVWRYLMTDEVWQRVEAIQRRVPDPLK